MSTSEGGIISYSLYYVAGYPEYMAARLLCFHIVRSYRYPDDVMMQKLGLSYNNES